MTAPLVRENRTLKTVQHTNDPVLAYLGLGANLGDAKASVLAAIQAIGQIAGVALRKQSSLYGSAPVDAQGSDYVNAVLQVETRLPSLDLLHALQTIELQAGRQRSFKNAPRTLDLDILLYGCVQIDSPELTLPHPRMWSRAFVLHPLAELAPELVSPPLLQAVVGQGVWRLD
jgi:2-amino-4-hydroxy-6-hydroxymethyldihydropteridine diphosphokinase